MKHIRILIATPRPVQRSRLAKALAQHPSLEVVAQATDLSETYTLAEKLEPDVVLLAEEFSRTPEFVCMRQQFSALEAAWLVIRAAEAEAGSPRQAETGLPGIDPQMALADMVVRIETALTTRLRSPHSNRPATATPSPSRADLGARSDRVVLIGASTGGVDALLTVLSGFPADCPPTAIVQHTGRGFSESLIALLDRRCAPRVIAATDGTRLQPGVICVAGGSDGHLRLAAGDALRCHLSPGPPVSGHVPSVDALFHSAVPIAERVVAALLTGMGRDGAEGMLALRRQGATTIGQDEASAVVYGMPRAAQEIGAVQSQLPLHRIGPEILRHCQTTLRAAARG